MPRRSEVEHKAYRRAYYTADAALRDRHRAEWQVILDAALIEEVDAPSTDRRRGGPARDYSRFERAVDAAGGGV